MSYSTLELRVMVLWNLFKPCSKIVFMTVPRRCFSCGSFLLLMLRACHAFLSVYCSLVGTCLEMAYLLVCLYVKLFVFCQFLMWCPWSGVYWFMIFAFLRSFISLPSVYKVYLTIMLVRASGSIQIKGKNKKFIGLGNAVTKATSSHRIAAMRFD